MVRSSSGGEGKDGGSNLICVSSSAVRFGCLLSMASFLSSYVVELRT